MASAADEPKPSTGVTTQDPQSPPSDNDGGERPVRKQLKETTIESTPSKENGRKRSFEESRDGPNDSPSNDDSRRKRSRECTPSNGQSPEPSSDSKDAGAAATSSSNVSDTEQQPKRPLPATPKELAKEDSITEAPPKEPLETWLDGFGISPRSTEQEELAGFSAWDTSDEPSGGSNSGHSSSNFDEPINSGPRDSHELHAEPPKTQYSASQHPGSPGSSSTSQVAVLISGSRVYCNGESSASAEPPEHRMPNKSKESSHSTESKSNENHPALENILGEPDRFEDHPQSQLEDPFLPQEKPQEYDTHSNPVQKAQGTKSTARENINENKVNINSLLQDILNTGTNQNTKGLTKKRSREQLEKASPQKSEGVADPTQESDSSKNTGLKSTTEDEREKKRHRDNSEERENKTNKLFSTSAFASAAADSPFAKLAGAKSPLSAEAPTTNENTTSGSAFAGSALGGFAGTEKSPFGTLGASTSSVFKSASPFSAAPSSTGFGGIGGGFGSAAATGKTSFASPNVTSTFGETKAKPLGAEESENDEDENEGEEETNTFEAAKTDERFFEQTIETGEEEEKTIFTCKAKLFSFTTGEWKERGIGTFKVNARDVDGKKVGRMIMRADGALRVMLNSPVFEGMNYGDAKNKAPTSKQIFLASTEEGRTVPLLLRTPNESHALDLYRTIRKLLTGEDEDESDDEEE